MPKRQFFQDTLMSQRLPLYALNISKTHFVFFEKSKSDSKVSEIGNVLMMLIKNYKIVCKLRT